MRWVRVIVMITAVVVFFIAAAAAMAQTQPAQSAAVVPVPVPHVQTQPFFDSMQERDRRYEQRFIDVERALAVAVQNLKESTALQFAATKEAVNKAETAAEKRFDSVNEFRNTLKDQQSTFISRSEVEIRIKSVSDRLEELKNLIQANTQRVEATAARTEGQSQTWGMIYGGMGLLIGGVAAAAGVASFLRRASSGSKPKPV